MKKRRLLSLLLAICMVMSLVPTVAYAAEGDPNPRNSGELRFKCQTYAVKGGSIYYKLNNTGDFTPVPVSEENDEYNSIPLTDTAKTLTIKLVPNSGFHLDTTRGVQLRVNDEEPFAIDSESIDSFTSSGYTFNLSTLVGDDSVSESSFELEFGFEPERGIFPAESFQVGFAPYGDEETAGKVEVQIGDGKAEFVQPWYDYAYDNGETPITFTLTPPAEAVDCTPFVHVVDPAFEKFFEPYLQQSDGKYSFAITPNTLWGGDSEPSFVVLVFWSEFDAFGPDEGQFMVETNVPDGNAYGTILVQPDTDAHKSFGSLDKYIYDKGDSEGTLYVTFIPQPGKKLVAFKIGNKWYGYEAMEGSLEEGVYPLPELTPEGTYTATITIPKLSDTDDYIYVEAIFEPAAQTADFTAGDDGVEALALLNAAKTGTEDSTWDSTTKVLTLKGVNFTTTAITAVKLPEDATIVLAEGTESIIASVNEGAGEYCSFGIYAEGDLTVEGDGALNAIGGTAKGRYTYSCGIYAYESNITVSGGEVNANGGTAYNKSFGIFAGNDVIISGGTVYATGGTAGSESFGILAGKNVAITGGTVTAMGGKTTGLISDSCGIYADVERVNGVLVGGTVTIEKSKVIATGGEASYMSRGIYAYNSVAVSQGADVTATGSTAEKFCTGIQADWDSVTIADSKVIATSNTANLGSDGISTNGYVTITGSADVTATGGTVTRKQSNDDSRGIYADYVTVEGGTVRATGGEKSFASYGICTDYDVTITGGTVIAKGREAEMFSDGIYAKGDYDYYEEFVGGGNVTISGGTVTATGDTAIRESSGIYAESSVNLSGTAHVTVTGSNAEYFSYGIYVNLTDEGAGLTISGGSLLAQASAEAESCAALRAEPDLTGYATYYWRTDAKGSYTVGNFVWNDDPYDTYVEIRNTEPAPDPDPDPDPPIVTTYPVMVAQPENGVVTVSQAKASADTTVTVTATPDEGYNLASLTVTDASGKKLPLTDKGDGIYTFTMPASEVSVKAAFAEIEQPAVNPFADVKSGAYYYDAVLWAVKKGITNGTSDTTFSPDEACTRAQVVTFLWRAAGCPAPSGSQLPFTDVVQGSFYEKAVQWAVETGITKGTSATTFSPDATCSRAQIVTFLWRAQGKPVAGTTNPFTDVAENAYYTNAVLWAVENGITKGTSATTFSPVEDCTRAQIVTFLYRCLGK